MSYLAWYEVVLDMPPAASRGLRMFHNQVVEATRLSIWEQQRFQESFRLDFASKIPDTFVSSDLVGESDSGV